MGGERPGTGRIKMQQPERKLANEVGQRRPEEFFQEIQKAANANLASILENIGDGIIIQDLNYKVLYENDTQRGNIGDHVGEFCYRAYQGIDTICEGCPMVLSLSDGNVHKIERLASLPDGPRYFELTTSPLRDAAGNIIAGIKIVRDITCQKLIEEDLKKSEEKYRSLVESSDDSIYLVDRDMNYLFINRRHRSRLGLPDGDYMGMAYSSVHTPEETEWFSEKVKMVFDVGRSFHFGTKNNRVGRYFLLTLSPVRADNNKIVAVNVISKDITELKLMEKKLHELSMTDDLTGLYNRRGFFTLAEQQIKIANRTKKVILLFSADLDGLKMINDTYGHHEGDLVLVEASNIIKETFRESDIIARIGGDEFVVLMTEIPEAGPDVLTGRLQKNLEIFNAKRNRSYNLSISIGMSYYYPESPCSIDELLVQADHLMYKHKKESRRAEIGQ
jgi:diguanylate cyclase (GGDEF)-like protein/PAS domain S-box-containing protein